MSQSRFLHRITQTEKKRGQTSMPRVKFEPTISVFELAKRFRPVDRAAIVIGVFSELKLQRININQSVTEMRNIKHMVHDEKHSYNRDI